MNLLAHLLLAWPNEGHMVGNFLADQVRGSAYGTLPPDIAEGVRMHRTIDRLTDDYPATRTSTARLRAHIGRYAPVAVDVLYDHFLAREWTQYCTPYAHSLEVFVADAHLLLEHNAVHFDPRILRMFTFMRDQQWLMRYAQYEGVQHALEGLSRRTRFPSQLELAAAAALPDLPLYQKEFAEVWANLQMDLKSLK